MTPFPNASSRQASDPHTDHVIRFVGAITGMVLCFLVLYTRSRLQEYHKGPLIGIFLTCFRLQFLGLPLITLGIAVGYTFFACSPGDFAALNLPIYLDFRRSLPFVNRPPRGLKCCVCRQTDRALVQFPCRHKCCLPCLDRRAATLQITCPYCRTRLFFVSIAKRGTLFHGCDRWIYLLVKGGMALGCAGTAMCVMVMLFEIGCGDWRGIGWRGINWMNMSAYLACLALFSYHYLEFFVRMQRSGDDWWRDLTENGVSCSQVLEALLGLVAGVCFCGIFVVWESIKVFG